MMKSSSCKAKGRSHQKTVAKNLSELLGIPVEKDGDIESRPMGQSGSDIILRGEAKKLFPFGIECKNVENLSIWSALKQAETYGEPILFFTRNRAPRYVALKEETFLTMYATLVQLLRRD